MTESESLVPRQQDWNTPATWEDAVKMAEYYSASDLLPQLYRRKPENIICALDYGQRLGIAGLAALQNIAVIHGRPFLFGDAPLAVARQHPDFIGIDETLDTSDQDNLVARCVLTIKRRDGESQDVVREFSVNDARRAKLWGKEGPWKAYPKRMLQMRARSWCIRDGLPDALLGARTEDEIEDFKRVDFNIIETPSDAQGGDAPAVEVTMETTTAGPPPSDPPKDKHDSTEYAEKIGLKVTQPDNGDGRKPKHFTVSREPKRGFRTGDSYRDVSGVLFVLAPDDGGPSWVPLKTLVRLKLVPDPLSDEAIAEMKMAFPTHAAEAPAPAEDAPTEPAEPSDEELHPGIAYVYVQDDTPQATPNALWMRRSDGEWFLCEDKLWVGESKYSAEENYDRAVEWCVLDLRATLKALDWQPMIVRNWVKRILRIDTPRKMEELSLEQLVALRVDIAKQVVETAEIPF